MEDNYIAKELVKFIDTYEEKFGKLEYGKDGKITEESLIKFVTELQKEMNKYGFDDIAGKELLPYCGGGILDGERVNGYQIVASLAEGDTYAYISSSKLGDVINNDGFIYALWELVGEDTANLILWGGKESSKYIAEGSEVMNLSDYLSKRIMAEVASGDVKPITFDVDADKVFSRTEFDELLKNDKVTSIWGEDVNGIKEVVNNPSKYGFKDSTEAKLFFEDYFYDRTKGFVKDIGVNRDSQGKIYSYDSSNIGGGEKIANGDIEAQPSMKTTVEGIDYDYYDIRKIENEFNKISGRDFTPKERSNVIKIVDKISGLKKSGNYSEYFSRTGNLDKTLKGLGYVSKGMEAFGVVATGVWAYKTIDSAIDKYKCGDIEGGNKIITQFLCEFIGGSLVAGYFSAGNIYATMWMATMCPIIACPGVGIATYIVLTCMSFFAGVVLGDMVNDLMYEVFDMFRDALAQMVDPLIVDLDGDGIETISLENGVHFDFNGDGTAEKMGWVGSDDGLLVYDENGNGKIDGGNELFGNATSISEDVLAANGFLVLANYDDNQDGVFDSKDGMYSKVKVWKDTNSDGKTDSQELMTLKEAGVQSIDINYAEQRYTDEMGNEHNQTSVYTNFDGESREIHDVWFAMDSVDAKIHDTEYEILEETDEVMMLPDLKGTGRVDTLHQAMLKDESGKLQSLVEKFVSEEDEGARRQMMSEILYRWSGTYHCDPYSRGNNIQDARMIETIEEFLGQEYDNTKTGANPIASAGERLEKAFSKIVDFYYSQLKIQCDYKDILAGCQLQFDDKNETVSIDFSKMSDVIKEMDAKDSEKAKEYLTEFMQDVYTSGLINQIYLDGFKENVSEISEEYEEIVNYADKDGIDGNSANNTIKGYGEDDLLYGFAGDDVLYGGIGDDTLSGGIGNDTLYGEDGNDTLYGDDGDDILDGGIGEDTLIGGNGNDTYIYHKNSGNKTIKNDSEKGTETIRFGEGISINDLSYGVIDKNLEITVDGTKDKITYVNYLKEGNLKNVVFEFEDGSRINPIGTEQLRYNFQGTEFDDNFTVAGIFSETYAKSGDDTVAGTDNEDIVHGGSGRDTLKGVEGNDTLYGENGQDKIYGGKGDDFIYGGLGNDILYGEDDNDTIYGGSAEDRIDGGNGNDTLYGENGRDNLSGGDGDDILYGGKGADIMNGGLGNDTLYGDLGNDTLYGNEGNDILYGGAGSDKLYGGAGDDVYIIEKGQGDKFIDDKSGNSVIKFGEGIAKEDIEYSSTNRNLIITIKETGETVTIDYMINSAGAKLAEQYRLEFADGTIIDMDAGDGPIKQMKGTLGDDTIYAGQTETTIWGNAGSDTINGNSKNDKIYGESGDDVLIGNDGDDTLEGGFGNDKLLGRNDNDILKGDYGNDILYGGSGNDTLYGGHGNDTLYGESGNDILDGGLGSDELYGGAGDDVYIVKKGQGDKLISDTSGNNMIKFADGIALDELSFYKDGKNLYINVSDGDTAVIINNCISNEAASNFEFSFEEDDNISLKNILEQNIDTYIPVTEEDKLQYEEGENGKSILGTAEDDKIMLSTKNTTVYGNGGDDYIAGSDSDDVLYGNSGNDKLFGKAGNDRLYGGSDNDELCSGAGDDILYGESGNDTLKGEDGDDKLYGGAGNDTLKGGNGNDILVSGSGNDLLYGENGEDTYIVSKNHGDIKISDNSGISTISFEEGISENDLSYGTTDCDFIITNKITGHKITICDFVRYENNRNYVMKFADGTMFDLKDADGIAVNLKGTEDSETLYIAIPGGSVHGEGGDDTIYGSNLDDTLYGGSGYDRIEGKDGDDIIKGNRGDDWLYGNNGNDVLYGNRGNDTIYGNNGADTIYGGKGEDIIEGGEGEDKITGGRGDDVLRGNDGNDILYADFGNDILEGGTGDDVFIIGKQSGNVVINDSEGTNVIRFTDGIMRDDLQFEAYNSDLMIKFNDLDTVVVIKEYEKKVSVRNLGIEFSDGTALTPEELRFVVKDNIIIPPYIQIEKNYSEITAGYLDVPGRKKAVSYEVSVSSANDLSLTGNMAKLLVDNYSALSSDSGFNDGNGQKVFKDCSMSFNDMCWIKKS